MRAPHILKFVGRLLGASALGFCALIAHADLNVPTGGSYALNGGTLDLGCTDLIVAGTVSVDSGSVTGIRNVVIAPGGSLSATSGTLSLSGAWSNSGTFSAGAGSVNFVDLAGCAPSGGTISGNTTFSQLSFTTSVGKTYLFAAGSTQTISQQLTIQGAPGLPLVWRSTTAGQVATIALFGAQSTSNFGAADIAAIANWIAPNQTNAISGGNVRVFGDPNAPIPTLPWIALLVMAAALFRMGVNRLSHANNQTHRTGN